MVRGRPILQDFLAPSWTTIGVHPGSASGVKPLLLIDVDEVTWGDATSLVDEHDCLIIRTDVKRGIEPRHLDLRAPWVGERATEPRRSPGFFADGKTGVPAGQKGGTQQERFL